MTVNPFGCIKCSAMAMEVATLTSERDELRNRLDSESFVAVDCGENTRLVNIFHEPILVVTFRYSADSGVSERFFEFSKSGHEEALRTLSETQYRGGILSLEWKSVRKQLVRNPDPHGESLQAKKTPIRRQKVKDRF